MAPIDLTFLGPGYPFFFFVVKFCISVLLIMFILSGMSNMVINYKYGNSTVGDGEANWVLDGTIGRITNNDAFWDIL